MTVSPTALVKQLLSILDHDRDEHLIRIDDYLHGHHDEPYMPDMADAEYKLLARRCVSNWMPLLVGTPAQSMYVDGFRRGRVGENEGLADDSPEWDHWQRSRLDARQAAVHRGALTYGHAFTVTERLKNGKVATKGLSALRTAALFEDPANDDTPYAALTVTRFPEGETRGRARLWTGKRVHEVTFKSFYDLKSGVSVDKGKPHGASECPVTRFAASVDLEGRTVGVIEPMIALQNRINQTVFDLLVAQTYASFKVRTVTGMAPPLKMKPVYETDVNGNKVLDSNGKPIIIDQEVETDENGNPVPASINHNARRFLFAEDPDVKWGSLDETPLGGFIDSIDMSIRHLAAVSQTPPHHLLGQIANLSAEALLAAETSLARKVEEFRKSFGESWERVFRIAGELDGVDTSAEDFSGEVLWRDMEQRSLAQAADALGKLKEQLGIPARGLWARVPGVTQNEIAEWESMREEDEPELALAGALSRSVPPEPALSVVPDVAD